MATLKFVKTAGRIRLKEQSDLIDPIDAQSSKEVGQLRSEVKYLKQILHVKRFGGGYSELIYKMKELETENQELRNTRLPESKVYELIEQNNQLKAELATIRSSNLNQQEDSDFQSNL